MNERTIISDDPIADRIVELQELQVRLEERARKRRLSMFEEKTYRDLMGALDILLPLKNLSSTQSIKEDVEK